MKRLSCPPAASSTRVGGGHFRTPIASLITNVTSIKRHRTTKHKFRPEAQVRVCSICLHISTQRRCKVRRTQQENRTLFPYLEGDAARRK